MLIAGLLYLLFSSGSGAIPMQTVLLEWETSIQSNIADKSLRKDLMSTVKDMQALSKNRAKVDKKNRAELLAMLHDYDTTTADIRPRLEEMRKERALFQQKIIDERFALKDKASKQDWEAIFGMPEQDIYE